MEKNSSQSCYAEEFEKQIKDRKAEDCDAFDDQDYPEIVDSREIYAKVSQNCTVKRNLIVQLFPEILEYSQKTHLKYYLIIYLRPILRNLPLLLGS